MAKKKMSKSLRTWWVGEYRSACVNQGHAPGGEDLIEWFLHRGAYSPSVAARLTPELEGLPDSQWIRAGMDLVAMWERPTARPDVSFSSQVQLAAMGGADLREMD